MLPIRRRIHLCEELAHRAGRTPPSKTRRDSRYRYHPDDRRSRFADLSAGQLRNVDSTGDADTICGAPFHLRSRYTDNIAKPANEAWTVVSDCHGFGDHVGNPFP